MHSFEAQNEHIVTYLLHLIDRQHLEREFPSFATHCLERLTQLSNNSARQLLICGCNFIPEYHALAPVLCVNDSCISVLSCLTIGRNPWLWGPATLQAMDTWYMKMLFVAHGHTKCSTDPLSLNRFRNGMTPSLSLTADSIPCDYIAEDELQGTSRRGQLIMTFGRQLQATRVG